MRPGTAKRFEQYGFLENLVDQPDCGYQGSDQRHTQSECRGAVSKASQTEVATRDLGRTRPGPTAAEGQGRHGQRRSGKTRIVLSREVPRVGSVDQHAESEDESK